MQIVIAVVAALIFVYLICLACGYDDCVGDLLTFIVDFALSFASPNND